jgi:hypothetical protein
MRFTRGPVYRDIYKAPGAKSLGFCSVRARRPLYGNLRGRQIEPESGD